MGNAKSKTVTTSLKQDKNKDAKSIGNAKSSTVATQIKEDEKKEDKSYTIDIGSDDMVFVVGDNERGELGIGHQNDIESLISWNKHNEKIKT